VESGWRGWLEGALLLLVLGGPVRCGLSSVYGFRRGLELDVLGDGGGGWLKSVSLAQKLIIIESACAHAVRWRGSLINILSCIGE